MATRTAFGEALAALGATRPEIVALDGEVADSTRLEYFAKAHQERFFECYIAEQQMVAAAVGMQARGWAPYVATFAAFFTRAYDFVRMAAVSRANLRLVGSHAGVSIGQDGPSQMGLEDIAAMRSVRVVNVVALALIVALGAACRLGRAVPSLVPRLAGAMAGGFSPVSYTNRSDRIFTTPRRNTPLTVLNVPAT